MRSAVVVVLALLVAVEATTMPCPNPVKCFAEPCAVSKQCKLGRQQCVDDYCGGCFARCTCTHDSECYENERCKLHGEFFGASRYCTPLFAEDSRTFTIEAQVQLPYVPTNTHNPRYHTDGGHITYSPSHIAGRTQVIITVNHDPYNAVFDVCATPACDVACTLGAEVDLTSNTTGLVVLAQHGLKCAIHDKPGHVLFVDGKLTHDSDCEWDSVDRECVPPNLPATTAATVSESSDDDSDDMVSRIYVPRGFVVTNTTDSLAWGGSWSVEATPMEHRVKVVVTLWDTDGDVFFAICDTPACQQQCVLHSSMNPARAGERYLDVARHNGLSCQVHVVNDGVFFVDVHRVDPKVEACLRKCATFDDVGKCMNKCLGHPEDDPTKPPFNTHHARDRLAELEATRAAAH